MKLLGKTFNKILKKQLIGLREEIQSYSDLLEEFPNDIEKQTILSRMTEFFEIADVIKNKDEKEDFAEASFCLMSSYDDIKERMIELVNLIKITEITYD